MGFFEAAKVGLGVAEDAANLANSIDSIIYRRKAFKENKRQFDAEFSENVRQFGLNYALKDYATRQGVSLEKARQLFDAETLALNQQTTAENLRTSAMGRNMAGTKFAWEKEDRANKQTFGKALQKGIVSGLLGGK